MTWSGTIGSSIQSWCVGVDNVHASGDEGSFSLRDDAQVGLRRAEGIALDDVLRPFGSCDEPTRATIESRLMRGAQPSMQSGWLQHSPNRRLVLTEPDGFMFSNQVISSIFSALGDGPEDQKE